MKTGRFFWGTFFVVIGLLFLLSNTSFSQVDWSLSWKFWPLILVFWGLSKFTENRAVKAVFATLNGILFACIIYGFFSFQWFFEPEDSTEPARYSQRLSEPYHASIERASFEFDGGAGRFSIEDTTTNLVDAATEGSFGQYELDRSEEDGITDITLRMEDRRHFRFFGRMRNEARIRLNANPAWEMRFNTGAAKVNVDLTPYKVERLAIEAGVSTIRVRLGDRAEEAQVRVKTGVSSVRIEVPSSAGCEVYDNAHIGSTDFDNLSKEGDRRWRTDNFESAPRKIFVTIDAGVSSFRLRRY
ncbi:MAG TPA: DUF5668 domain-containing protein, partial [Bacteroidota bacterium]|nr:DUF5668 domain-containing protein [Bacteroidota bacterium]